MSDDESALIYLLRFVNRVITPGTLSPVERAYLTGAKVTFDQLSAECQKMLERKVSDLIGPLPETTTAPQPASHPPADSSEDSAFAFGIPQMKLSDVRAPGASGSLTDRLARLETQLDLLTQVIGQGSRPNPG